MKRIFIIGALFLLMACGNHRSADNHPDTPVTTPAAGNTDGMNTTAADTTHIDTTAGKVKK